MMQLIDYAVTACRSISGHDRDILSVGTYFKYAQEEWMA